MKSKGTVIPNMKDVANCFNYDYFPSMEIQLTRIRRKMIGD